MGNITFSKISDQIAPSQVVAIRRTVSERATAQLPVYSFIMGDNPLLPPVYLREQLAHYSTNEGELRKGSTKYSLPEGISEMRSAAVKDFDRQGITGLTPENIIVTAGGLEAIHLALSTVCDAGDRVIVQSPYYMFYPAQVLASSGAIPKFVQTTPQTGFKLTPEMLEEALTPDVKAVIINHPHNPSGMDETNDEMRALAAVAKLHNVLLILDEVYERFVYDNPFVPFAAINPDLADQTLSVNSASKSFGISGLRCGWAAGPKELVKRMAERFKNYSSYGTNTLAQKVMALVLTRPEMTAKDIEAMIAAFRLRRDATVRGLADIGMPCVRPTGAFYAFPELPAGLEVPGYTHSDKPLSLQFAEYLVAKTGVAVGPGIEFGMDGHIRIAFVVDEKTITEGLGLLGQVLQDLTRGRREV